MAEEMDEFLEQIDAEAQEAEARTNNETLNSLIVLAEEAIALENQMADLAELQTRLSSRANELKTKTIPDKMAEIGLSDFSLPSGHNLKVEDFVAGTLPKDPVERAQAIAAIESWGAGDVIRTQITIAFDREEHDEAVYLYRKLSHEGIDAELASSVHPQTYLALIRERLAAGEPVDPDVMNVFVGRKAKLTLPKPKQPKASKKSKKV